MASMAAQARCDECRVRFVWLKAYLPVGMEDLAVAGRKFSLKEAVTSCPYCGGPLHPATKSSPYDISVEAPRKLTWNKMDLDWNKDIERRPRKLRKMPDDQKRRKNV